MRLRTWIDLGQGHWVGLMNLKEFLLEVKSGSVDIVECTEKVFDELGRVNEEFHYMNAVSRELAIGQARKLRIKPSGKLAGVPVSVKDSICVKGVESTAGSKMLAGYKPLFHATVVERSVREGALIVGKTGQDEFGFGGFSTNVGIGFKVPLNPFDKERVTGGSSGGAAGLAQKMPLHIALGESTGGSIVNPASFCGVFGLAPTYGLVSRYGLIDYGNSLDKVGPLCSEVYGAALMLEVIAGFDEKDATSLRASPEEYTSFLKKDVKGMRVGIIKDAFGDGVDKEVEAQVKKAVGKLESLGCVVKEISLPLSVKYGIPCYYLIATSEASSNLAKLCGMRYGLHEQLKGDFSEYFTSVRSHGFGKEAKRRIMLGTFARMSGFRDAYYIKAMKVRTKIIEEYKKAFKNVDVLVSPTVPMLPPKINDVSKLSLLENYMIDVLTVGPNLAGLPHANVPVGFSKGLPVGMMVTADHLKEGLLFQVAKEF